MPLAQRCPQCKAILWSHSQYCSRCGAEITSEGPAAQGSSLLYALRGGEEGEARRFWREQRRQNERLRRQQGVRPSAAGLIAIGIIVVVLAISNPSKPAYSQWIVQEAAQQSQSAVDRGMVTLFGGLAASIVGAATIQHNFVVFSVFTTEIDAQHSVTVLGIAGQFIPLSSLQ